LISKSTVVNIVSILLIVSSFFVSAEYSKYLYYSGLFALSGAVTNWLAIYMIFNKVPFLYGSGVIELNFEKFKSSIKSMIMEQFFTKNRLEQFFEQEEKKIDLTPIIEEADFNVAFDALKESVMESKFGQLINMFGGEESLELLRVTFTKKLKSSIISIVSSEAFQMQLNHYIKHSTLSEDLITKVDNIVSNRLNELGPQSVKELVSRLIAEHLEWLVVWGGIFGGLIGLVSSFISLNF